jgi:hypothetical protein
MTCGTLRSRSDAVVAPLLTIWSRLSETAVEPTAATPRIRVPVTMTSVTVSVEARASCLSFGGRCGRCDGDRQGQARDAGLA